MLKNNETKPIEIPAQFTSKVGMPIAKYFPNHGYFRGTVESYDVPDEEDGEHLWTVKYEDEDSEQLNISELDHALAEYVTLVKKGELEGFPVDVTNSCAIPSDNLKSSMTSSTTAQATMEVPAISLEVPAIHSTLTDTNRSDMLKLKDFRQENTPSTFQTQQANEPLIAQATEPILGTQTAESVVVTHATEAMINTHPTQVHMRQETNVSDKPTLPPFMAPLSSSSLSSLSTLSSSSSAAFCPDVMYANSDGVNDIEKTVTKNEMPSVYPDDMYSSDSSDSEKEDTLARKDNVDEEDEEEAVNQPSSVPTRTSHDMFEDYFKNKDKGQDGKRKAFEELSEKIPSTNDLLVNQAVQDLSPLNSSNPLTGSEVNSQQLQQLPVSSLLHLLLNGGSTMLPPQLVAALAGASTAQVNAAIMHWSAAAVASLNARNLAQSATGPHGMVDQAYALASAQALAKATALTAVNSVQTAAAAATQALAVRKQQEEERNVNESTNADISQNQEIGRHKQDSDVEERSSDVLLEHPKSPLDEGMKSNTPDLPEHTVTKEESQLQNGDQALAVNDPLDGGNYNQVVNEMMRDQAMVSDPIVVNEVSGMDALIAASMTRQSVETDGRHHFDAYSGARERFLMEQHHNGHRGGDLINTSTLLPSYTVQNVPEGYSSSPPPSSSPPRQSSPFLHDSPFLRSDQHPHHSYHNQHHQPSHHHPQHPYHQHHHQQQHHHHNPYHHSQPPPHHQYQQHHQQFLYHDRPPPPPMPPPPRNQHPLHHLHEDPHKAIKRQSTAEMLEVLTRKLRAADKMMASSKSWSASLELALARLPRGNLLSLRSGLGMALNRLGTPSNRRSKHGRIAGCMVLHGLQASVEVTSGRPATKQMSESIGNSVSDKKAPDYTKRVKDIKSKLWCLFHDCRHSITRGSWESRLLKLKETLEEKLVGLYGVEGSQVAQRNSPKSSHNVNHYRSTTPFLVKRVLRPNDLVKVYWTDGNNENEGQWYDASLVLRDGIESWEVLYTSGEIEVKVLDRYICLFDGVNTLPSHYRADQHIHACLERDRQLAMSMSPMSHTSRPSHVTSLSAHVFLRDHSSSSPGIDEFRGGDAFESPLGHLLVAVGALVNCKATGDVGAGAVVDMISHALKDDDALRLLHTCEDVLAYARCFEDGYDSDDEGLVKDPNLHPGLADMLNSNNTGNHGNQTERSSSTSPPPLPQMIGENGEVAADKPKRKRRWRKKPEGWVDEPKKKKSPALSTQLSMPSNDHQANDSGLSEAPSSTDQDLKWAEDDGMIGRYVYGLSDTRRRPAKVLSNRRGHALVEYIGGRNDAKSWIPVTSLVVIDPEQGAKIAEFEMKQKSLKESSTDVSSSLGEDPNLSSPGRSGHRRQRMSMVFDAQSSPPQVVESGVEVVGDGTLALGSLNSPPPDSPGTKKRRSLTRTNTSAEVAPAGRMSPRLNSAKPHTRTDPLWPQNQQFCMDPNSLPKVQNILEKKDILLKQSNEQEALFSSWYGACGDNLNSLNRQKPSKHHQHQSVNKVTDIEGRRPLQRICLPLWKPPSSIPPKTQVSEVLGNIVNKVETMISNDKTVQEIEEERKDLDSLENSSTPINVVSDSDPISYWLLNFFDPYEVGLTENEEEKVEDSENSVSSTSNRSSSRLGASSKSSHNSKEKETIQSTSLPPRALPRAYEEAALASVGIIRRLEDSKKKIKKEIDVTNNDNNDTEEMSVSDAMNRDEKSEQPIEETTETASLTLVGSSVISSFTSPEDASTPAITRLAPLSPPTRKFPESSPLPLSQLPFASLVEMPEEWMMSESKSLVIHFPPEEVVNKKKKENTLKSSNQHNKEEKVDAENNIEGENIARVLERAGLLLRTCAALLGLDLRTAPSMQLMKKWGGGPNGRGGGGARGVFGGSRAVCRRGAGVGGGSRNLRRVRAGSVTTPLFAHPEGCRANAPLFGYLGNFNGCPGSGLDGWYGAANEVSSLTEDALISASNRDVRALVLQAQKYFSSNSNEQILSSPTVDKQSSSSSNNIVNKKCTHEFWSVQLDVSRLTLCEVLTILIDFGWSSPPPSWLLKSMLKNHQDEIWTPTNVLLHHRHYVEEEEEENTNKNIKNSSSPVNQEVLSFTSPLTVIQFFRHVFSATSKLKLSHGALMRIAADRIINASRITTVNDAKSKAQSDQPALSEETSCSTMNTHLGDGCAYACENCTRPHDGMYGSGRFCSVACRSRFNGRSRKPQVMANPQPWTWNVDGANALRVDETLNTSNEALKEGHDRSQMREDGALGDLEKMETVDRIDEVVAETPCICPAEEVCDQIAKEAAEQDLKTMEVIDARDEGEDVEIKVSVAVEELPEADAPDDVDVAAIEEVIEDKESIAVDLEGDKLVKNDAEKEVEYDNSMDTEPVADEDEVQEDEVEQANSMDTEPVTKDEDEVEEEEVEQANSMDTEPVAKDEDEVEEEEVEQANSMDTEPVATDEDEVEEEEVKQANSMDTEPVATDEDEVEEEEVEQANSMDSEPVAKDEDEVEEEEVEQANSMDSEPVATDEDEAEEEEVEQANSMDAEPVAKDEEVEEEDLPTEAVDKGPSSLIKSAAGYSVGDAVIVESRTYPGMNKPGGHGRITKIHSADDNESQVMIDVKYILGGSERRLSTDLLTKIDQSGVDVECDDSNSEQSSRQRRSSNGSRRLSGGSVGRSTKKKKAVISPSSTNNDEGIGDMIDNEDNRSLEENENKEENKKMLEEIGKKTKSKSEPEINNEEEEEEDESSSDSSDDDDENGKNKKQSRGKKKKNNETATLAISSLVMFRPAVGKRVRKPVHSTFAPNISSDKNLSSSYFSSKQFQKAIQAKKEFKDTKHIKNQNMTSNVKTSQKKKVKIVENKPTNKEESEWLDSKVAAAFAAAARLQISPLCSFRPAEGSRRKRGRENEVAITSTSVTPKTSSSSSKTGTDVDKKKKNGRSASVDRSNSNSRSKSPPPPASRGNSSKSSEKDSKPTKNSKSTSQSTVTKNSSASSSSSSRVKTSESSIKTTSTKVETIEKNGKKTPKTPTSSSTSSRFDKKKTELELKNNKRRGGACNDMKDGESSSSSTKKRSTFNSQETSKDDRSLTKKVNKKVTPPNAQNKEVKTNQKNETSSSSIVKKEEKEEETAMLRKAAQEKALLAEEAEMGEWKKKHPGEPVPRLCDGPKCSCRTHATRAVLRISATNDEILAEYCSGSVAARKLKLNQSHVSTSARSGGSFFAGLFRFRFKDPNSEAVLDKVDVVPSIEGSQKNHQNKRSASQDPENNHTTSSNTSKSSNSNLGVNNKQPVSTSSSSSSVPTAHGEWMTGGDGFGDGSLLVGAWAEMYEEWDPILLEVVSDLLATAWTWSEAEWSNTMSATAEEEERKSDAELGLAFPHGSTGAHRTDSTQKSMTSP